MEFKLKDSNDNLIVVGSAGKVNFYTTVIACYNLDMSKAETHDSLEALYLQALNLGLALNILDLVLNHHSFESLLNRFNLGGGIEK